MAIESAPGLVEQLEKKCQDKLIPLIVQFELTNKCNLKCRHCFMVNDNGVELTLEEIKDIIDQLVEMGTFHLVFTGGEIFTRADLFSIAGYAKRKGFLLTFMTNGTLITPEKIEEIKKLKPVRFEFSLHGATAKTHDYITQAKGSFDRTVEAIKELIELGIDVTTKTVLMNSNIREYEAIKSLSEKLGAHPRISPGIAPKRDGSSDPSQYDVPFEDLVEYLPEGEDYDISYLLKWQNDPLKRFMCKAGRASCYITHDGTVYPCVMMPIVVGNLHETSFKELWHTEPSHELKRLRDLTSADLPTCSKCDLAPICIRCPGVAYLETGDLIGASPSACRYAQWREYSQNQKSITVMQGSGTKSAV